MSEIQDLIIKLNERGMQIEPHPEGLEISFPKGQLSPEFRAQIQSHKAGLLAWLNVQHLIKQCLAGEFDGDVDPATIAGVANTLNCSGHPLAALALERLFNQP